MNAYGLSTDGESGFLRESGGLHEEGIDWPAVIHEEYDWQQPPQFPVQFQPEDQGVPQSLPAWSDAPTERWLVPRKTG